MQTLLCRISLYPEYGWSRLPAGYRDSPFFRVDEAIVGAHSHVQQSAADSTPQLTAQDDDDTDSPTVDCEDRNSAAEHYWLYAAKAAACREMLCTLTNCTYLVDNTDALDILLQSLQKAYEQLLPCIPSEDGLQLNSTCEQHSQRRSKK